MRKFLLVVFILYQGFGSVNAQLSRKSGSRNPEKALFGKSSSRKKLSEVKEPRYVLRAKKKQEAKDRKLERENKEFIQWSKKRTIDIQTPEVQDRMKKDKKDSAARDKAKKKKIKTSSKKAARKYK